MPKGRSIHTPLGGGNARCSVTPSLCYRLRMVRWPFGGRAPPFGGPNRPFGVNDAHPKRFVLERRSVNGATPRAIREGRRALGSGNGRQSNRMENSHRKEEWSIPSASKTPSQAGSEGAALGGFRSSPSSPRAKRIPNPEPQSCIGWERRKWLCSPPPARRQLECLPSVGLSPNSHARQARFPLVVAGGWRCSLCAPPGGSMCSASRRGHCRLRLPSKPPPQLGPAADMPSSPDGIHVTP
jgi:hypothetical protein